MAPRMEVLTEAQWKEIGKQWKSADNDPIFANWGVYPFWGATLFGFYRWDKLVSVNATRFGKGKKKNAWGKYTNFYLAYTPPEFRRQGHAKILQMAIEGLALEQGYARVKSLTQSYLGLRLHMSLGHWFWGVNERNEIGVDTPLDTVKDFPAGVPIEMRGLVNPHLLNRDDLLQIVAKPPFVVTEDVPRLNYRGGSITLGNATAAFAGDTGSNPVHSTKEDICAE